MKIGISLPNLVRGLDATTLPQWAIRSEDAGFATLGLLGRFSYPGISDTVALTAAAAVTSRIGLLSHILVAPSWPAALLAKEVAGIDAVSGGRLTLGIGVGARGDDFPVAGLGLAGRGRRLDADLATYRSVWRGEPVNGGENPAVPAGTRQIPLLFGANGEVGMRRAVREGDGFIGSSAPASMVGPAFEGFRGLWTAAGRSGQPRLVALAYFTPGDDGDAARTAVRDFYGSHSRTAPLADVVASGVAAGPVAIKETVATYEQLGVDELIFLPTAGDPDDVSRLADAVL